MKLFTLNHDGVPFTNAPSFATKQEAKSERDKLNDGKPEDLRKEDKPVRYTVTYGVDHRHYR